MAPTNEVTAADIARLAGVGRAAVSNWRRRHADFPQPVGGPATSPTFSLDDVRRWLHDNGRASEAGPTSALAAQPAADVAPALVALLPPLRSGLVIDPACGDGARLAAVADRFGSRVRRAGQDAHPTGDYPTGSPLTDDALARYRRAADAAVCDPPLRTIDTGIADHLWEFGPPSQMDVSLAWLQLAFEYVKPGGTAVVLMPFSAAVRASARRIRAELLRSGALRRVIALPLRSHRTPAQIWTLERPLSRPSYSVDMVSLDDQAELPQTPEAWKRIFADSGRSRTVPSIELLDDSVLLVPATHIEPPERDYIDELGALATRYRQALDAITEDVPAPPAGAVQLRLPSTTIADLTRLGVAEFVDRHSRPEPGDVVISAGGNRFEVTVAATGADRDSARAEVLRCDPDQLDPHFVACFLRSETNRRQAVGTLGGTFRLDVRRARIPRIPIEEQRRYAEAYCAIAAFTARAEAIADAAADIARTTIDGLTAGALQP